jgi:hypothetical protein
VRMDAKQPKRVKFVHPSTIAKKQGFGPLFIWHIDSAVVVFTGFDFERQIFVFLNKMSERYSTCKLPLGDRTITVTLLLTVFVDCQPKAQSL